MEGLRFYCNTFFASKESYNGECNEEHLKQVKGFLRKNTIVAVGHT